MPDLLDPASLPHGVAIANATTLDERLGLRLTIAAGARPGGVVYVVMKRREALALGLQLSQAAHRLSRDEDRG